MPITGDRVANGGPVRSTGLRVDQGLSSTWLRVLGIVLVAGWAVWAGLATCAELRWVSVDDFRQDLASGKVVHYAAVTRVHEERVWPPGGADGFDTAGIDADGKVVDGTGQTVEAVAYYVDDALVAPIRLVRVPAIGPDGNGPDGNGPDGNGIAGVDHPSLIEELRAAGVRHNSAAADPGWRPNPFAEAADMWGLSLGFLALVVLLALPPTRGARWFWFWLLWAPLGLGVLLFAVLEFLKPRRSQAPSGDAVDPPTRWSGLRGWVTFFLARVLIPF